MAENNEFPENNIPLNLQPVVLKHCRRGKHYLDITNFPKDRTTIDGLYPVCKDCRKIRNKIFYDKRKQKHEYLLSQGLELN